MGGLLLWAAAGEAGAATVRVAGFSAERHLGGLGSVTDLAFAPDGTLFFTEKSGAIKVLPFGVGSPRVFATVMPVYTTSECGLLGIALHPDYRAYGQGALVYVFATVSGSEQRIISFKDEGGVGRERREVRTGLPTLGANHDGGCLRIGPDGKFYLAIGDGGSGASKAQDLTNLFGKVLRLNMDGTAAPDNPDLSAINANYRREIYAYGFRNPFRLAFRPTGPDPENFQLFVNDVGSAGTARREEVNRVQPGLNYGWPNVEGIPTTPDARYQNPLVAYRDEGNSIVGGVFYQGTNFPSTYRGNFFYMDYGSNKVFRMVLNGNSLTSNTIFADAEGGLISMAEGPDGLLYYTTNNGQIFRIRYETPGNQKPVAALLGDPLTGGAPLEVSLDASGSSDPDGQVLRYDWSFGDGTGDLDGPAVLTHRYSQDGVYTARVVVVDSSGGSASATARIEVSTVDLPPAPEILTPAAGASYDAGVTVEFSGRAVDPEDGPLPANRLGWEVILHHADHTHPWLEGHAGSSGSFSIPAEGLEEEWSIRIRLTATDSKGHAVVVERTVGLNYLHLRFVTEPSGLRVTADGVSLTAPAVYQGVRGARVELGAPSPQAAPGGPHLFRSWSDGGEATHEVTVSEGLVFTAVFEPDPRAVFLRGDATREGSLDLSDAIYTLQVLFADGPAWPCPDAADANDDGLLDISDPIAVLFALFAGTGPLPEPSGPPGFDPTPDSLGCAEGGGS